MAITLDGTSGITTPGVVGNLSVSGNTTVGGTLTNTGLITASAGVAVGGVGAANTLDDYEEGTFTHTVSNFSTAISSGWTTGRYVKIGNKVWIHGVIVAGSGTVSGTCQIGGLPFTVVAGSQGFSVAQYSGNITTTTFGQSNINPVQRIGPGGTVMDTGISSGTGGINFVYSAHYTA